MISKPDPFIIVDGNTIRRETRDKEEETETRPRKRQRVDEEGDSAAQISSDKQPPKAVAIRDEEYYKDSEDADCVVRVQNTLFKVHSKLFYRSVEVERHCKTFQGKTSDDNPILLIATNVADFRALSWALYQSPQESMYKDLDSSDVDRLLSIAACSHTYKFTNLHNWVKDALFKAITDSAFIDACSSALFTRIVDVAKECDFEKHLAFIVSKWSHRVSKTHTPSVPAMIAADKHNLPELRGIAYYTHIQDMLDRQTNHTALGATQLRTDDKLTNGQVMRVLTGYWSLVTFWERFRKTPLGLPCGEGCDEAKHVKCKVTWERRWNSAIGWKRILQINSGHALALIDCLRDELHGDDELKEGTLPACRLAGLNTLKKTLQATREGLHEHFLGCM